MSGTYSNIIKQRAWRYLLLPLQVIVFGLLLFVLIQPWIKLITNFQNILHLFTTRNIMISMEGSDYLFYYYILPAVFSGIILYFLLLYTKGIIIQFINRIRLKGSSAPTEMKIVETHYRIAQDALQNGSLHECVVRLNHILWLHNSGRFHVDHHILTEVMNLAKSLINAK